MEKFFIAFLLVLACFCVSITSCKQKVEEAAPPAEEAKPAEEAEKKVVDAGYDPARLPPGQYLTEKWPVLHAGSVPTADLATWDFKVWGEVDNPLTLSWDEFSALPTVEVTEDIHCVTRWSRFDTTFLGVPWSELEKRVSPRPSARYVIAHAEQGYTANVPISFLRDERAAIQSIRAGLMDGLPWYTEERVRRATHPETLLPGASSIVSLAIS